MGEIEHNALSEIVDLRLLVNATKITLARYISALSHLPPVISSKRPGFSAPGELFPPGLGQILPLVVYCLPH